MESVTPEETLFVSTLILPEILRIHKPQRIFASHMIDWGQQKFRSGPLTFKHNFELQKIQITHAMNSFQNQNWQLRMTENSVLKTIQNFLNVKANHACKYQYFYIKKIKITRNGKVRILDFVDATQSGLP